MNTATDTLMPAQHHPDTDTTHVDTSHVDETPREGVKAVALFESRPARAKRAWDELSEIDRAVLLEAARQRRELQRQKQEIYTQLYGVGRLR